MSYSLNIKLDDAVVRCNKKNHRKTYRYFLIQMSKKTQSMNIEIIMTINIYIYNSNLLPSCTLEW